MILYDLYFIRHNCIAPFLIKISHRSLAITFGYSLSNRGAVSLSTVSIHVPRCLTRRKVVARRHAAVRRLFRCPLHGAPTCTNLKARGVGPRAETSMAHNRCCAQASAPARAAARDRGADGGLHQRRRGLAPSGPGPARERRLGRMPSTLPTPTESPGTGNGWTTTKGRSTRRW